MKRELLFINEEAIQKTLQDYQEKADEVNKAINEAENLLSKELFPKDKESLLKYGWSAIEQHIRSTYGFPNGDIDAVLKLQGLDASKARAMFVNVASWHSAIGFEVNDNNEIVLSPDTIEKVKSNHTKYTRNEKQVEALKMAKKTCNLFNESKDLDLLTRDDWSGLLNIKSLSKLVELSIAPRNEQVFVPAVKKIAQIRG